MATQMMRLPAADSARAAADRTIQNIFDNVYIDRVFEENLHKRVLSVTIACSYSEEGIESFVWDWKNESDVRGDITISRVANTEYLLQFSEDISEFASDLPMYSIHFHDSFNIEERWVHLDYNTRGIRIWFPNLEKVTEFDGHIHIRLVAP
jgi:hypothetical protein